MRKYTKLSKPERSEIMILYGKGYSMRKIAIALERSPNTISYEIKKNSVCGEYKAQKADRKAHVRKRMSKFQWKKINEDEDLRTYIIEKLQEGLNPDEIAGRMRLEKKEFSTSKTAIYDWLHSGRGNQYCKHLYSKRYRKKKRVNKTRRVMIPDRVSITERPVGAENRSRYGHWEEDTVVSGRQGSGALAVMIERKSRYVVIRKLSSMSAVEHVHLLKGLCEDLKVLSVTFDNGIENKQHQKLGIPTYFCDPYSSWQKGSVENLNKMIRQYIPKGSDISTFSDEYVHWIQNRINKKPRKILGYRSAQEVAMMEGIIH